jgi:CelD/BcsL family acetyltransferase involved in cellulose biosynthesis
MLDGVSCEIVRTTQNLGQFQSVWRALWSADPNVTPFQSPEWLLPWWRRFGQQELQAIVVLQCGRPIGFLPFYVYREPSSTERQLLLLGAGTSDYLDGIFAPECRPEHVRMALELIRKESSWDVLYAAQLRSQSTLFQALEQAGNWGVRQFRGEHCSRMRAVQIADLPVKIRRNAMYYRNRAARRGTLELSVADESDCSATFDALVSLHTARWNSRGTPGTLYDRRVLDWHREALPQLQASGMLRLCSLRLDGEILGILYSLIDPIGRPGRTQYFYLTAYSTGHAELRPGTLLLAFAIERAAREGVETIDMLRGEEEYRKIWHLEPSPTYGFAIASAAYEEAMIAA